VAAVEHALGDGVEQLEGRHDGASGQHFDLEIAAGHIVDLLGEVVGVLVEDILRGPRALPAHADGALRLDDGRRCNRSGTRHSRAFQEFSARGNGLRPI
jgi:hypothetical protein